MLIFFEKSSKNVVFGADKPQIGDFRVFI